MADKKRKTGSGLLCVTLILVTLFSAFFLIREAGHDCSGGNCPHLCLPSSGGTESEAARYGNSGMCGRNSGCFSVFAGFVRCAGLPLL